MLLILSEKAVTDSVWPLLVKTGYTSLLGFFMLSAVGTCFIAWISERQALAGQKTLVDKFAWHMAQACRILVLSTLPCIVGGSLLLLGLRGFRSFLFFVPPLLVLLAVLFLLALGLVMAYVGTWNPMRERGFGHVVLGAFASLVGLVTLLLFILFLWAFLLQPEVVVTGSSLYAFFVSLPPFCAFSPLYVFLVQLTAMVPAVAAEVGLVYLLFVRDRDDFGRDYYQSALHLGGLWGFWGQVTQLAGLLWFGVVLYFDSAWATLTSLPFLLLVGGLFLGLLGLIALGLVIHSDNALRQKPVVMAGAVCQALGIVMQGFSLELLFFS
ncbi:membrane hypothetical protein [Desulfovibrionales bacterium]